MSHYLPHVDGLRAVAVLAVVLYHLGLPLPGGYVGVDVFFVISGYLITGIIARETQRRSFTFVGFYERRVRRILPAFFFVLVVSSILAILILLPSDLNRFFESVVAAVLCVSNVFFQRNTGYFTVGAELSPLLHTWSLAVEEQFYLLFPPFLLVVKKFFPLHLKLVLSLALLFSLGLSAYFIHEKPVAVFFLPVFRAWELLLGCVLALHVFPQPASRFFKELLCGLGLTAILVSVFLYGNDTTFPGIAALLPCLGAALVIHQNGTLTGTILSHRIPVFMGLISYSLYLWHWPLFVFYKHWIARNITLMEAAGLFLISIAAATLTWKFVEAPFRRRDLIGRGPLFVLACVCALSLIAIALFVNRKEGILSRHSDRDMILEAERSPVIPFWDCFGTRTEFCRVGHPDGPLEVFIWGDSHSLAMLPVLDSVYVKTQKAALYAGTSSCPPLFDVENHHPKVGKWGCEVFSQAVLKAIESTPSIKTVLMVAAWRGYVTDTAENDLKLTGYEGTNSKTFGMGLEKTLRSLNERGISVTVIGQVPMVGYDLPFIMARREMRGLPLPAPIGRSLYLEMLSPFHRIVYSHLDSHKVIDIYPHFFGNDGQQILWDGQGLPLYRDNGHLNRRGAMYLYPHLLPRLIN